MSTVATPRAWGYDPPDMQAREDTVLGAFTLTRSTAMGKGNKTRKKEVKKPKQDKKLKAAKK